MSVLKIAYKDQIRRITVADESLTWAQLSKTIGELFSLPEKWILKYVDDEGDEISVSSDRELSEALRLLKSLKTPSLRFTISAVKDKEEKSDKKQPSSVVEMINQIAKEFPFLEVSVETDNSPRRCPWKGDFENSHRAFCDNCSAKIPFPGSRFKCNTCPDYDLCEKCKNLEYVHSEHKFVEIKDPKAAIHPAFCDACNNIVVGDRYKCNTCPDFDLCQACTEKSVVHTQGHEFTKIARPLGRWTRCQRNMNCNNEAPNKEEPKKEEVVPEPKKEEAKLMPLIPLVAPIPVVEQPKPVEIKKEVKEEKKEEVKEEKKEEAPQPKDPFTLKLDQLEEMGFKDRVTNINLMLKHRGDLVAVVKELLF